MDYSNTDQASVLSPGFPDLKSVAPRQLALIAINNIPSERAGCPWDLPLDLPQTSSPGYPSDSCPQVVVVHQ
jgi:hypothetical protein